MENELNFYLATFSIFEKYFCIYQRQSYQILRSERTINFLIHAYDRADIVKNQHCDKFCVLGHFSGFEIIKFIRLIKCVGIIFNHFGSGFFRILCLEPYPPVLRGAGQGLLVGVADEVVEGSLGP